MLILSDHNPNNGNTHYPPLVLDGAELESTVYDIACMLSQITESERRIVCAFVRGIAGKGNE